MPGPGGPGGPGGPHGRTAPQKPKDAIGTIKRLLGYLTRTPWPLLLVLVCLLCSVGANLGGTYALKGIINNFLDPRGEQFGSVSGLAGAILRLACIYVAGALATYCQSAVMVQLAHRGVNRLRKDLFDALQTLPLSYFDQHPHGELMSRFTNDADNVQATLEHSVVSLFSSCLMFVGLICLMVYINPTLFLVTVVILAVTAVIFKNIGGKSRRYYQTQQAALGAVNGNIQEIIEGLKVVKAFTHEEKAKADFETLNNTYRDAAQKATFYGSIMGPVSSNLMNAGYAVTAVAGGVLSLLRGFDLGGLIVYLTYSRQVAQPLEQVSQQMTTLLSALAGAERIFEVMNTAAEVDQGQVTLVPAGKDQGGTLTEGRSDGKTWAWKTPKGCGMALVPVLREGEHLTELAQAEKTGSGWQLLSPDQLSDAPVWGALNPDGSFLPLEDMGALAGHGWAWKYAGPDGQIGLHLVRGAVRNVPGEDYYLTELRGAVRFKDVDFSYVPGKRVLHRVTVYANPGQKIAFVGSTGAGKTTITNLINRFYEIEGGSITYDGIDIKAIAKESLRRSLGAVLQDTHLFTGTVMENIRYGRLDATDEACIAAAKTAGAHSFIRRLPDGYNTMVTGDGANLSQGQRQLLAIARAAVADPPVMILDEATSSIDTRTEALIQKGMDALMENRTVFVIAHRLSTVRNADCIVVIEHGQIQEKGSHAELLEEQGRYYQLYTGQFQLD